jgi:hypothetical protein
MAVMARESWTDKRLDDLKENVNERFDSVNERFDSVEGRMTEGFARVDSDIREMRRTMIQGFFVLVGVMVSGFLALAGLIAF